MNGSYYTNQNIFPNNSTYNNVKTVQPIIQSDLPYEQAFTENILRMNKGKKVIVYMTFPYSNEMKEFKGIIEQTGKDFITLSEPSTGKWALLPLIYLNYIIFDEMVNYNSSFNN